MKIIDNRKVIKYKDLSYGDVFKITYNNETKICMKTTLALEWFGEDCEVHGLKKDSYGRYRQEFCINLSNGLHFEVEPNTEVEKLNASLRIE